MKKYKILLYYIATIQLLLGAVALFFPGFFIETVMQLSPISNDIGYPVGMLASRFLAFGLAFIFIAKKPQLHQVLIYMMVGIQLVDLLVGLKFLFTGVISIQAAMIPLLNAALFSLLLTIWKPKTVK